MRERRLCPDRRRIFLLTKVAGSRKQLEQYISPSCATVPVFQDRVLRSISVWASVPEGTDDAIRVHARRFRNVNGRDRRRSRGQTVDFRGRGFNPPFFFSLGHIPTQIELWNFRFCRNPMFGQTIVFDPLFMIVTRNSKKGSISLPSINLRSK